MKVYGIWHGGYSYGRGDDDDIEVFPSIRAAAEAHESRYRSGYSWRQHFGFVNREPESTHCPAVDESSEMWLFLEDPTGVDDKYPDRIIKIGPRDGVRVERI